MEPHADASERHPKSRWSLELGKVAGIPIRIHATFLLLVAWVAMVQYSQEPSLRSVGAAVLFLLVVFGLVVMHELSHALTARAFGVKTRSITLWPIGGVSNLERMPEQPLQELLVSLAGPALNVVIALGLGIYLLASAGPAALLQPDLSVHPTHFLASLFWVNVVLAVFNLLPAFPMDGGRALRALLSVWLDRVQATRLAAGIGRGLAVLFGILGLFSNPFLILIAGVVWIGAGAEAAHAELNAALGGHTVSEAMLTHPHLLSPDDPLDRPASLLAAGEQRVFPVVEPGGRTLGALGERQLLEGLARYGREAKVRTVLDPDVPRARPEDDLMQAVEKLGERHAPCVLVEEDGRLVGVLTRRSVSALYALSSVLHEAPRFHDEERPDEQEPVGAGKGGGPPTRTQG